MPIAVRSQRPSSRRSAGSDLARRDGLLIYQYQYQYQYRYQAQVVSSHFMGPDDSRSDSGIVVKPRDLMPAAARTLPARYYTDTSYFDREIDLLFRKLWFCAGRVEEVSRPGQFVPRDLGGDSIIVTSAADGRVHAFHNVCRHRGTRLCTETSGIFAGSIQCPYHAWTYGLDGRLLGAPHMEEVPHFRKSDYPLHRVHTDTWDG